MKRHDKTNEHSQKQFGHKYDLTEFINMIAHDFFIFRYLCRAMQC